MRHLSHYGAAKTILSCSNPTNFLEDPILGSFTIKNYIAVHLDDKIRAYEKLIQRRKGYKFINEELINPADTPYDINEIEPWAQWQNNLNARIVAIGQEFCDTKTYAGCMGRVERFPDRFEYPSNRNLREYFKHIGYDIGHPLAPNKQQPVFLTNAVMGLKDGNMSANFKDRWLKESREEFLIPLLEIIEPEIVIPIGRAAFSSVARIYGFKAGSLLEAVERSPIVTDKGVHVFPVFHTGGLGLSNRPKDKQLADWDRIGDFLAA